MPYEWVTSLTDPPATDAPGHAEGAAPIAVLHLWPFRSLPKRGFVFVIGLAFAAILIPISAFIGTLALWWLLIPALAALAALWWFIDRSYHDGEILEELEIWPDHIRLTRTGPRRAHAMWEANLHWVTLHCHAHGGPVLNYLTLTGAGREVEIGAFLHEDERPVLHDEISRTLTRAKSRRTP